MNRHLGTVVVMLAGASMMPLAQSQTSAPSTPSAETVAGSEIQAQWVGKEVTGRAPNGARVLMTMNADGSAKLLIGSMPDNGRWRPWEQGYCTTWQGLRGGQETCFTVKREGDKFQIFRPDGASNGIVEVK